MEFCSVNMDAWYYRISVACDTMDSTKEMWGQIESINCHLDASVVHSTWHSQAMWRTHASTFNKWHKKKNNNLNKKTTLHMLTHDAMRGCGLTSWVVCINDKFGDIRERNVTIKSEIWTMNIRFLGFQDIRECVTLWKLILRSLRCSYDLLDHSPKKKGNKYWLRVGDK